MTRTNIIFFILSIMCLWLMLTGIEHNQTTIFLMFLATCFTLLFTKYTKTLPQYSCISFIKTLKYFFWLIKEIYKSAFAVMKIIVQGRKLNPIMQWIDTNNQNIVGKAIYSNSITLTPGTFTVDERDNRILIHALEPSSIDELKSGVMSDKIKDMLC